MRHASDVVVVVVVCNVEFGLEVVICAGIIQSTTAV
jgi:phosphosulfolactate phosphohydrolase-like enzyme